MNATAGREEGNSGADSSFDRGMQPWLAKDSNACIHRSRLGNGDGMHTQGDPTEHRRSRAVVWRHQPVFREGQAGVCGMAERPVGTLKPGNAGGGRWFRFKGNVKGARTVRLV